MTPATRTRFFFVQALTLVRAPLIFLFLLATILPQYPPSRFWFCVALLSMILSAVTDMFDGYYARKFNVTSQLGSYADPMTDKVFYLTTFPTLVFLAARAGETRHATILLFLTILFLLRDQWVSFLRQLGALHNLSAKANWSGKARTIISFPTICVVYYYLQSPRDWPLQLNLNLVYALEAVSMFINAVSIWVYTVHFWPAMKVELTPSGGPELQDNPSARSSGSHPTVLESASKRRAV